MGNKLTPESFHFHPKEQECFLEELLMESYMTHSEILAMSESIGYTVDNRTFYCTLLLPLNLTPELAVANKLSRYQILHLVADGLGQFCGEKSTFDFQMMSAVMGKEIAILLSFPTADDQAFILKAEDRLRSLLEEWLGLCKTRYGLCLRASTSTALDLDNISLAYTQAKELSGFMTMLSLPDNNLFYEDVVIKGWELNDAKHIAKTKQWESAFLNALERNDFPKCRDLLHDMAEYEFRYGHITIQAATPLLYTLLNKFRMVLDSMRPFAGPDVLEVFDVAPRILYRKSVDEVMEQIDMIFSSFLDSQNAAEKQTVPAWIIKMDNYIQSHYTDPDLNVSTLSSQFGLCAAYAGRIYKSLRGYSILDRINYLRIDRACVLLRQNMLLKDVAVEVGYENRLRMNRAFLKYTGYTPKEAKDVPTLSNNE